MALQTRIGEIECLDCGEFIRDHKWCRDDPSTHVCPLCGGEILFVRRKKNPHFGQMSNDINSDLYYKNAPVRGEQKVSEANRLEYTYNKIEYMEATGKTPKVDDTPEIKAAISEYKYKETRGIEI
jgi:ribosomal protein L32